MPCFRAAPFETMTSVESLPSQKMELRGGGGLRTGNVASQTMPFVSRVFWQKSGGGVGPPSVRTTR